jgi:hypothetical protein
MGLCKCKKFRYANENDLHSHMIYTPYIQLLRHTHKPLVIIGFFNDLEEPHLNAHIFENEKIYMNQ